MPVYEFACNACGARVSVFVRSMHAEVNGKCDRCGSTDLTRLISKFSVVRSRATLDTDSLDDRILEGFDESNPRAMADWARRMREELGDDWGPEAEGAFEQMMRGGGGGGEDLDFGHDHGDDDFGDDF